jgi:hypothetical protein
MPHDIIDNRTRELAPEINAFLADSIRAHFAVDYFFLSSFEAKRAAMEQQIAETDTQIDGLVYELHEL